jgi:uncharacterized protein YutE (UPF0331/DUF86 family)
MIDVDLVTRKLLLITTDLAAVEPLAEKPRDLYLASTIDEVLAERYLERIVGRMIDVNYHLLTESGQPPPPDYFQSFVALGTLGVLDPEFARRIASSAGLRNRIVHEYDAIDPAKVHDALQTALPDIRDYLRRVRTWIQRG